MSKDSQQPPHLQKGEEKVCKAALMTEQRPNGFSHTRDLSGSLQGLFCILSSRRNLLTVAFPFSTHYYICCLADEPK